MPPTMDTLVSLCKRRGFVFQSSEIYGGTGSCWDYGPLGVELKNKVKQAWWREFVQRRADMVGLDASIIMHPMVWKASGHVDHFTDPMVDCRECKHRFRADHVDAVPWVHYCPATKGNKFTVPAGEPCSHCGARRSLCPDCGKGELTTPRQFNLMFKTFMGPVEEDAAVTYLRPETAQGIFVNFDNVLQSMRLKLPFGIAQIGKAFRNEITPGNFIFRTREFEQMEIEFFVNPLDAIDGRPADEVWHERWIEARFAWYQRYGMRRENLRIREHEKDELAHYAKRTVDIEYQFPIGWSELEGVANRTDFDLKQHAQFSGKSHLFRRGAQATRGAVRDRAVGRGRSQPARLPGRCLPRGGSARRASRGAALPSRPGAREDRRATAVEEASGDRDDRSRSSGHAGPTLGHRLRRHRGHRSPLSASGRSRHALLCDGGRSNGRRLRQGRAW